MKRKLSFEDQKKFDALIKTRDRNFRLLEKFGRYLNFFPDAVKKEEIDALGGEAEFAFYGILTVLFGLEPEEKTEDKIFCREYLLPSIKKLDACEYRLDPYYQNIRIPDKKKNGWEFKNETYPPYRAFIYDDLFVSDGFRELPPLGFFDEEFSFPAVLENGQEWMLITPNEIHTAKPSLSRARGKVITFGLGLGYWAYMASEKEEVESCTVIEKDENVISLFREIILPQFPHKEKIRIIQADAFEWAEKEMPKEKFDLSFVDTWHDASDGLDMYLKMKKLEKFSPETEWHYWIEKTLLSYLRWMLFREMEKGNSFPALPGEKEISSFDEVARLLSDDYLRELAKRISAV